MISTGGVEAIPIYVEELLLQLTCWVEGQPEMIVVAGQELFNYISDERCLYTTNIVTRDM